MNDELYSYEGLLVLIDCLNQMIDVSGNRQLMINTSKETVVEAYEVAKNFLPVEIINSQLKITNQKLFRLKVSGKCTRSSSKYCLKLCPTQLSISEQLLIRNYLSDSKYENLPLNHIWAEAHRNGLHISINTFYKYVRHIRGKKQVVEVKGKKHTTVEAEKPFQILHMDSTTFRCMNGERVYVHFVMDNYSRTVLGAVPSYSSKSIVVAKNLMDVIIKYKLRNKPFELYCDDGPENHGYVNELLKDKKIKITKIVANYKTSTSNNMIEAWNKKFKWIILKKFKINSLEHLEVQLPKMMDYFNNLKLPVLGTLSPNEAIAGMKYDDFDIKTKMAAAKKTRLGQNRLLICNIKAISQKLNHNCELN
ncbi:MAG: DDE-type integrase/transposase/recombinase [Bacteroidota bacterium]